MLKLAAHELQRIGAEAAFCWAEAVHLSLDPAILCLGHDPLQLLRATETNTETHTALTDRSASLAQPRIILE